MSELPVGWVETNLGEISAWGSGGTPRRSNSAYFGGDIPWVTITDLTDGVVSTTIASITQAGVENSAVKLAPAGSVLVALYGSIGKLGMAGVALTTNQAIAFAAPDTQAFDSKFLFYYLRSERSGLLALGSGVTQKNIYLGDLKAYRFPLAPRAEQTRIVAKLEELLTDLDLGVAELKAAQKKLAQYRQSLLKAAVVGSLTAEWRDQNTPTETGAQLLTRILQERRVRWEAKQRAKFKDQGKAPPKDWQKNYPVPVKPDTSHLPELPKGWVWATIDQIAQVGTGVTPLRSKSAYFINGSIPWVTSGALNSETVTSAAEHVTELALKECRLEVFPAGSLLVAMYGEGKTRGKCAELLIPGTINQAIAAIVLEPAAQSCKAYLKAFLLGSYEGMRSQASGGVQPNLNLQIVKSIALPLPPQAEQTAITLFLNDQFDQLALQQAAVELAFKQSFAQRQNILRTAFSGQLVPQDPDDEPVGDVLTRIRAQRADGGVVKKLRGPKAKAVA